MAGNRAWSCYYCKITLPIDTFKKHRLCPTCGSDIHACRNCAHFDEFLTSKCREPQSDWISDRTSQNECIFFEMRQVITGEPSSKKSTETLSEVDRAKAAFKALFRDPR